MCKEKKGGREMPKEKGEDIPTEDEEEDKGDHLENLKVTTNVAKYSMMAFGFAGIISLYVTVFIWDLSMEYKLLYTSILSLSLAFILLGVYSILSDSVRAAERDRRRKRYL
jgi:hypothetical protein